MSNIKHKNSETGKIYKVFRECPRCKGKGEMGWFLSDPCRLCHQRGYWHEDEDGCRDMDDEAIYWF